MKVITPEPRHVFAWVELAKAFEKEAITDYNWGLNEDDLHRTYHAWDKENWGFLLEHEGRIVGVLAGLALPHFFDYSNLYFNEFMWYVKPEYRDKGGGLMLYRALLRRCRELGVSRMVFSHTKFMAQDFARIYKKLGFTYLQTSYEKVLNGNE